MYAAVAWWRHQMVTFSALLAICAGNSPVTGEFPAQRPVTRSFDVFSDLRLNKRLSKQSWGWKSERPSHSLWRHCNDAQSQAPQCAVACPCNVTALRLLSLFKRHTWGDNTYKNYTNPRHHQGNIKPLTSMWSINTQHLNKHSANSFGYPDSKFMGQHVTHLGPVGPRWAPCWNHEPCYQVIYQGNMQYPPWHKHKRFWNTYKSW